MRASKERHFHFEAKNVLRLKEEANVTVTVCVILKAIGGISLALHASKYYLLNVT